MANKVYEDKTKKREIVVHSFNDDDHNYNGLISIGWKKIDDNKIRGDYILISKSLIPELIKKLKKYNASSI